MDSSRTTILVLVIIILGLSAYLIWGKLDSRNGTVDIEPALRDSIALIEKQRVELELKVDSLNRSYDSLLTVKQKVRIEYYEKIKFVHTADPAELDSIIHSVINQ